MEGNKKHTPIFITIAALLFFALCLLIFIVVCKSPQSSQQNSKKLATPKIFTTIEAPETINIPYAPKVSLMVSAPEIIEYPKTPSAPKLSMSLSISEMRDELNIPFAPKVSTTISVSEPDLIIETLDTSNETEVPEVKAILEQKLISSIIEIPNTPSVTNIDTTITPITPSLPQTLTYSLKAIPKPAVELLDVYKDRLIDYNEITINLGFKDLNKGTVVHFALQSNDDIYFNTLNDYFINPRSFSYIPQDDDENILLNIVVEKTGTYNINLSLEQSDKTIYKLITINAYN